MMAEWHLCDLVLNRAALGVLRTYCGVLAGIVAGILGLEGLRLCFFKLRVRTDFVLTRTFFQLFENHFLEYFENIRCEIRGNLRN